MTVLIKLAIKTTRTSDADGVLTLLNGLAIKGQVKQTNIPIPCRVRLFERLTGRLINEVLTDSSGNYEFDHLAMGTFFIIAHHPLNQYNAVIADLVVPK
ncbi:MULTISPECIES: carboxypeptidase regulatory-like domain-containing protein [unclassified Acinetobacter]|uniref:carboxypeptidase regulatory-like domain-containing protein n=1 Tax=unclassified Acinetobacter TaxID=196816 RepID=UPI002448F760|nr:MULTISPECIES: carboxypeptidase regulatory-like domain-containing protein [unclassified Acinetobacter]MDH0033108.1 carboxypeptidase regulatory-like domain-containing protein [Acinetobacter sp. GD04021]MDH0888465.1 carboxypeptidase regulatory-like domain-containing protein [Acinetobacter sp. GD03873]MDH1084860.1 carboxypeptidase regulatory-like domain-containing protein [Acinetobacter sp. GD03983]MDH2191752.1 carboxypeptidase regulatory-like domain-containing protein [Acinetobacter sp. GD03645